MRKMLKMSAIGVLFCFAVSSSYSQDKRAYHAAVRTVTAHHCLIHLGGEGAEDGATLAYSRRMLHALEAGERVGLSHLNVVREIDGQCHSRLGRVDPVNLEG